MEVGGLEEVDQAIDDQSDSDELGGGRLNEMLTAMDNGREYDRRAAIWRARLHPQSRRLVAKLVQVVQQKEAEYASIAAAALGEMKAGPAVPVLRASLRHASSWVQESAAYALGLIGDASAREDLEGARPSEAGLSRWIFEDALARLSGGPGVSSPHARSLRGASVYFLGAEGASLRDGWRPLVERYGLRVDGISPPPLNTVMRYFGGPPDTGPFESLLKDRDGRPQVDAVVVSGLLAYEFPPFLRWRLFQFVRRGGVLIVLGNTPFVRGEIRTVEGRVVHFFAHPPQLWHQCLPPKLDSSFRPFIGGFRGAFRQTLRSGVADFGHGRTILLASASAAELGVEGLDQPETHSDHRDKNWGQGMFGVSQIENLLLYGLEGESPFHALLDLYTGPEKIVAGEAATFSMNLFSATGKSGTLDLEVRIEKRPVVRKTLDADLQGRHLLPLKASVELPWTIPDGTAEARMVFITPDARSESAWTFAVTSPLRLSWNMEDSYEKVGGELSGQASVEDQLREKIEDLTLAIEVADHRSRTLQRHAQPVSLRPGPNGPFSLKLQARDYLIGSYTLCLKLLRAGEVIQKSIRLLHRCGPYRFDQDLVYVPWNTAALPSDERMRNLLLESGFNGVWGLDALPGWYNWGVDGPRIRCMAAWPGDWVEQTRGPREMTMAEFGRYIRHRLPGYSIMDPWDESAIEMATSERGEDLSGEASGLYRNWLKSRYFGLEGLNRAWEKDYQVQVQPPPGAFVDWSMPGKARIPPPRPWQGDLTSWNQVWAWRGSPADWRHYAESLWGEMVFSECLQQFRKTNRGTYWHWADAFHTRLYMGCRPGQLNWECHRSRARFGHRPSTIMLHFYYAIHDKRPEAMRVGLWDALAGGGRHLINWSPNVGVVHGLEDDCSIWYPDYTLRPHGRAVADSIRRARTRAQVLLDGRNALSRTVAFLYSGASEWPFGVGTPRALFDALLYAGIHPESLQPGVLRSDRMPLESFRVIFQCGDADLPEAWKKRIDAWQKQGGRLLDSAEFSFQGEGDRTEASGFTAYQSRVLARLEECGVKPPVSVVDDNGLPEPAVQPVLLETEDRSQQYLLAVVDWSLEGCQAFGGLEQHDFEEKVDLREGLSGGGVRFTVSGKAERYQAWAQVRAAEPFAGAVSVDGKPGLPLTVASGPRSLLWSERGLDGKPRWVAGPAFELASGEHALKVEVRKGQPQIDRVWVVGEQLLEPKLLCRLPGVREVYDVYGDRLVSRVGEEWPLRLQASFGEVYGLVTEDLGPVEVKPRLLVGETDRRLEVKVMVRRADGQPSGCRHAFNLSVLDAAGREIEGLGGKASVLGWRVVTLYPAHEDPPLPWTVEAKDITSGRSGQAQVSESTAVAFAERSPLAPVEFRADPLDPLEGHLHFVPFRVRVTNRKERPLKGVLETEIPGEWLLEGETRRDIEVAASGSAVFEWVAALGRPQAVELMDRPPRAWLALEEGPRMEVQFEDVWVRRWEKAPPLLTNFSEAEVPLEIQSSVDRQISGRIELGLSTHWEMLGAMPGEFSIPASTEGKPASARLAFKARIKAFAPVSPEVVRMSLRLHHSGRVHDIGYRLVELEKRREWLTALPPLEAVGVMDEFKPEMPAEPVVAVKGKLWGLEWKPEERDTLIDFEVPVGQRLFAFTHVCFPEEAEVAVRIRGEEKVDVWLAGERMLPRGREDAAKTPEPPKSPASGEAADTDEESEPAELKGLATMRAPAGRWLPLVLRYHRQTSYPNTDLVFLNEAGRVLWEAEFRANPPGTASSPGGGTE
ncbi:MAG: HEAT repeat domain-containing protein [Planctomycetes bacterium]|nr:HEAT repeat domain-containing protein [Planctomycetota bacterium]